MKKIYIAPSEKVVKISTISVLMTSGGVSTNSTLGNEYSSTDESYTKESSSSNIWDNEW